MFGRTTVAAAALLVTLCCANPVIAADNGQAAGGVSATQLNFTIPARVPLILQAINPLQRSTLSGNTNKFITSGTDNGALAADQKLDHLLLGLRRGPQQEQALQQLIADLHNPNSPNFHKWLTADQFGQYFGPAQSDVNTVVAWLQDNGFVVNEVSKGLTTIDFSGTASQVNASFGTTLKNYTVDGVQYISNAADPSIPAALSPVVTGIVSLNNGFKNAQFHRPPAPPLLSAGEWGRHDGARGTRSANLVPYTPNFTYTTGGALEEDVAPGDFNVIYDVNPVWAAGHRGAGQTIVVIERTRIKAADWTSFRTSFGLSGYAGTLTQSTPAGCTNPGQVNSSDQEEAAIDAEWAGVAAPDANISLVACKTTSVSDGIDLAVNQVVNAVPAPTIASLSYGQCESSMGTTENAQYNAWWQQAATEGMSVFVSTGDQGAAVCDNPSNTNWATAGIAVSGLASTPYNIAVGGTDFRDFVDNTVSTYWNTAASTPPYTSAKSYVPEIPWNSSCASSIVLQYVNSLGGGYADNVAFCNSSLGLNFVDITGGSGGPSSVYTQPNWQGTVYGAPAANVRGLPDISLFASSGFYGHALVYCMSVVSAGGTTCNFANATDHRKNSAGGTSFAAPSAAGIQALVNQVSGQSWGNMNTEYYALAAAQFGSPASPNNAQLTACNANLGNAIGSTCVFNDVTSGDITVPCKKGSTNCYSNFSGTGSNCGSGGTTTANTCGILSTSTASAQPAYAAAKGWDFSTGLGSLNVANLIAAITPVSFTVTASVSGGNGTITPPSQSIGSGNTATFTITPNSGYHVLSVNGDTCTVSNTSGTTWTSSAITANCAVTATFAIDQFTVSASVSGGNGTVNPPSQTIDSGSTASITVTPNSGYHVLNVIGDTCSVTQQGSTTTWTTGSITNNCAITATFSINQYTVTAAVSGGNGSVNPPTQTIDSGNTASITVTPNSGYHVLAVIGDTCSVTQQGLTTTWTTGSITNNCAITATFAIDQFTVTAAVSGGNGTVNPPSQTINSGDTASITVTPDPGYHVLNVNGDTCSLTQQGSTTTWTTGNITGNCAITATFAIDQFTVTAAVSGGNGAVDPPSQTIDFGNAASITVTPDAGYHVLSVTGDTCSLTQQGSTTTWTTGSITDNCAITATFEIDQFTVTAGVNGSNGTISPPSQSVNSGDTATFTITPDAGYHVQSVSGDTCTVSNTSGTTWTSSTITGDCAVSVTFAVNVLVFTTQPSNVVQGDELGTVVVTEEDGSGNVVDDNATVDFTIAGCGGTVDLGNVQMVNGVATLDSAQAFYTTANNLQIVATTSFSNANSQSFNVTANADVLFADGFDGCRL